MMKRSMFLVGVLAVFSLGIASAKSYDIVFSSSTMVGKTQLAAGDYTLKVEGSNAVFTNVDTRKSVSTAFKIQNVDKKYDETAVETARKDDGQHLQAIELGGSKTRLEFN